MKSIEEWIARFKDGNISRRNFIKTLTALGLSVSCIQGILSSSKAMAAANDPKRGGRLVAALRIAGPNDTLDPAKSNTITDYTRCYQLYNGLVTVNTQMKPEPELAESWEYNDTGDKWIFNIRKNVEYHNGKELKADDVVYSIRRILNPDVGSPGKPLLSDIEEIYTDGPHKVVIKLKAPNIDLLYFLADYHAFIIPDGFTDFDNPIGTGPFKLKKFSPGVNAVVERNPNYWKNGLPYLDEVETYSIPDPIARFNALLSGEVHLIEGLDPKMLEKVEKTPEVEVDSVPSALFVPFIMDCTRPPFDDPNVRNALKYLVDRQKYVDAVFQGHGRVGNDHPISIIDPFYCDAIPVRQYDPDKAKSLLKKAGVLDMTFELFSSDGLFMGVEGALVYSQMAAKAGVNVKVVRSPADGYWDAVWMKKPFCMSQWAGRPTANMMLSIAYKSDAPWNETRWKRPDFDKLLIEARSTTNEAKRKELYCEMELMLHNDGGNIIPGFVNLLNPRSSKVKGVLKHPWGLMGGHRFSETVWFES